MANRYDFWTHGITAIIHDPRPAKEGGPVQFLERAGHGITLKQEDDTFNWFFLPIPTPTVLNGDTTIYLRRVVFSARVNENAKIDQFQLWRGGDALVPDTPLPSFAPDTVISHPIDDPVIRDVLVSGGSTPVVRTGSGIVLGLRVSFVNETPMGQVWIFGAGGHFS